ncbi:MAG: winged helix-turn-helix transcriptional regulator [Acidimicrobiales bacterium]
MGGPARLKQLERLGIVEVIPKAQGRGHRYLLTTSGDDLFKVCETLGEWGARWLEIALPTWNGRSMFAHIKPDADARAVAAN